jgi:glucose-6-phosphate isomerase
MNNILEMQLGNYQESVDSAIMNAQAENLIERIWAKNHLVWSENPEEISNRLGWLDIADRMQEQIPNLEDFAEKTISTGIENVLLLGMGGSSLAPEVFSKVFTSRLGFPKFSILDSTDPRAVIKKMDSHDPKTTLYIVATKSGGTVETISLFKVFYNQAAESLGKIAGEQFVAITDPGSKLEALAEEHNFRKVFINDPNIGGRYSALSYFGLIPAALMGIDLAKLLKQAIVMARDCRRPEISQNPGARLGITLGVVAEQARDKLTLVIHEDFSAFGDWVEQLVAESTGKSGKGILPVLGNSWLDEDNFSQDRLMLNLSAKQKVEIVNPHNLPSITIDWEDPYQIGAQIFLLEFATAIAGHIMGIHPFNQPNVESAKVLTRNLVAAFEKEGRNPERERNSLNANSIFEYLKNASEGDYICLQAYTEPNLGNSKALLKLKIALENYTKLACTFGFGPRFLHSTGQLHKGDRGNGYFIQMLDSVDNTDLDIPKVAGNKAASISFKLLKQAQAAGDAAALIEGGRNVLETEITGNFAELVTNIAGKIYDQ